MRVEVPKSRLSERRVERGRRRGGEAVCLIVKRTLTLACPGSVFSSRFLVRRHIISSLSVVHVSPVTAYVGPAAVSKHPAECAEYPHLVRVQNAARPAGIPSRPSGYSWYSLGIGEDITERKAGACARCQSCARHAPVCSATSAHLDSHIRPCRRRNRGRSPPVADHRLGPEYTMLLRG